MNRIDKLLDAVIKDAKSVGFPITKYLQRKVYVDENVYDRVGMCVHYSRPYKYEIHLTEKMLFASDKKIKDVLAHEVLHSYCLTMDHGSVWQIYQEKMNDIGYNVQESYSWHEMFKK